MAARWPVPGIRQSDEVKEQLAGSNCHFDVLWKPLGVWSMISMTRRTAFLFRCCLEAADAGYVANAFKCMAAEQLSFSCYSRTASELSSAIAYRVEHWLSSFNSYTGTASCLQMASGCC